MGVGSGGFQATGRKPAGAMSCEGRRPTDHELFSHSVSVHEKKKTKLANSEF